jgi:adenylate cyclase, class 2
LRHNRTRKQQSGKRGAAHTFIEVETTVPDSAIDDAIKAVRAVLETLGITANDLTTEQYTDAVRQRRQ